MLKYIAAVLMLLDHIALHLNVWHWLYWPGRLAYPIFLFYTVQGVYKTKNIKNYKKKLFIAAIISQLPYGMLGVPGGLNIIFTLFLVVNLLEGWKEKRWIQLMIYCLLLLVLPVSGGQFSLALVIPLGFVVQGNIIQLPKIKNKAFFYWFYPVHLAAILFLKNIIGR